MTRTAPIVGGTGRIGLATAAAPPGAGWRVIAASASGGAVEGAQALRIDREASTALTASPGAMFDYAAEDAWLAEHGL